MIVNVNCLSHALNQKIVALCIPEEKYHCMERVRKNPINELKATLSFTRAIYGCPFLNQWGHLYRKDWCDFLSAFPALTILQVTGMGFLFLCFLCRITQLRSFSGNNKQDILSLPTTRSSSCPPLTQAAVSCWRILLFFFPLLLFYFMEAQLWHLHTAQNVCGRKLSQETTWSVLRSDNGVLVCNFSQYTWLLIY